MIAPIAESPRSATQRNGAGDLRLLGLPALTAADTAFGLALYHEITSTESGNVFFSPYSISTALSMAMAGARGNTAEQMRTVLGVSNESEWHGARNRLELALSSQEGRSYAQDGEAVPMTLEPTNAIFGQSEYSFRDAFLDLLAADYGAGMQAVDFRADPEAARLGINDWVGERTHDRITELLRRRLDHRSGSRGAGERDLLQGELVRYFQSGRDNARVFPSPGWLHTRCADDAWVARHPILKRYELGGRATPLLG